VALVEDNEDIRDVTRELLELAGHQVLVAGDGPGGLAMLLAERPDVAFVDIGLPGLSGYDVARRVREVSDGALKLVALTGYGRPEDVAAAREAGFDAHLVKPVESRRMAQLIRTLVPRT
jgi:CheY-like chemotaxis protein